ncbi:MAG: hypothetical protein AAF721_01335 [Myxococcota bacterium]
MSAEQLGLGPLRRRIAASFAIAWIAGLIVLGGVAVAEVVSLRKAEV